MKAICKYVIKACVSPPTSFTFHFFDYSKIKDVAFASPPPSLIFVDYNPIEGVAYASLHHFHLLHFLAKTYSNEKKLILNLS